MSGVYFDIVYMTHNSGDSVGRCFDALSQSLLPCDQINIIAVDRGSSDDSVRMLKAVGETGRFASFKVLEMGGDTGFGSALNAGFAEGSSGIVCFFDINSEVFPETLTILFEEIENSDAVTAVWELRRFPYEHPKDYDALTGVTDWCCGGAFAVRRNVFEEAGGFDGRLFMHMEDIDLSFRIRSLGYKLKYCPKAVILRHECGDAEETEKTRYIYGIVNNLMLRYRFGTRRDISAGLKMFHGILSQDGPFKGSRKALAGLFFRRLARIPPYYFWRFTKAKKQDVSPVFQGFDVYARQREGAEFRLEKYDGHPLVSVIVRTHARPAVLKETLISLRNQTYDNFEIVIVEDGEECARRMIDDEFPDLKIRYTATGGHVGRSAAGNLGMELARGEYLNFLDDDDLFYADHIETLVQSLKESGMDAAYSLAYETAINVTGGSPYTYEITSCQTRYHQPFNRLLLLRANYIPIQSIMFKKRLFELYGGLDTALDNQEDYDMWIRYALKTDFVFVPKTTSIYRVPSLDGSKQEREETHWEGFVALREKIKNYELNMSAYDAGEEVIRIIEIFENDPASTKPVSS